MTIYDAQITLDLFFFSAQSFAAQFKMDKAKVIRINRFGNYAQYEIDNTNEKKAAEE